MAAIAPVRRGNTQRRPFSQRGVRRPPERIAFRRPQTVDKARFNKGKRAISMSRREKYEATRPRAS